LLVFPTSILIKPFGTNLILNSIIVTRKAILPMNAKNKLVAEHEELPNIKHKSMQVIHHSPTFNFSCPF
jgi:hypothetical protein